MPGLATRQQSHPNGSRRDAPSTFPSPAALLTRHVIGLIYNPPQVFAREAPFAHGVRALLLPLPVHRGVPVACPGDVLVGAGVLSEGVNGERIEDEGGDRGGGRALSIARRRGGGRDEPEQVECRCTSWSPWESSTRRPSCTRHAAPLLSMRYSHCIPHASADIYLSLTPTLTQDLFLIALFWNFIMMGGRIILQRVRWRTE